MRIVPVAALLLAAVSTAGAAPPQASTSRTAGGLSGLLGTALPNVASVGAGNAAGVLGYCVKNNVLQGDAAASVLGRLTGKPGVTTAPGFAEGQAGTLQTGSSGVSLKSLKGQVRTRLCDMVLKRAGAFL